MQSKPKQYISRVYLIAVPIISVALGFGVGHVSYQIYLPVWIVNVFLTLGAIRALSIGPYRRDKHLTIAACLLIIPWMLMSIFAGMGPPPSTAVAWVANAVEQQIRYTILAISGILMFMGFALLKEKLKESGEKLYSQLGFTAVMIAIPLFILNMVFWGYYLTDAFRVFGGTKPGKRPDWYIPITSLFYVISVIEVTLIYLSTALFATSFKTLKLFSLMSCNTYIVFCIIGIVLVMLPPSLPQPFGTLGYLVAIPAIPFIMPYLMGINLLWQTGNLNME